MRTREPGGTPAGEQIRHVLLSPEFEGLDARAEALLFAAARGEHVARVIRPALRAGRRRHLRPLHRLVGRLPGLRPRSGTDRRIRDLSLWATGDLVPDLTIVLDVNPEIGLSRLIEPAIGSSRSRWSTTRRVREAFLEQARDAT